ncbi:SPX3 protein, partial [Polypterus senegalus]
MAALKASKGSDVIRTGAGSDIIDCPRAGKDFPRMIFMLCFMRLERHSAMSKSVFLPSGLLHIKMSVCTSWYLKSRGIVFGLWSACASAGNILGAFLASCVLQYGYEYAFLVTSSVQFAGGVVVFFGLLSTPKEVGLCEPSEEDGEVSECEDSYRPLINDELGEQDETQCNIQSYNHKQKPSPVGFFQAVCLPGVIPYSLAYACLKLVNYAFFFWLPFYMSNNFGWKEADSDKLSIWYDVGGIIGGTVQGLISDMLHKRAPVLAISLILAIGSVIGYSRADQTNLPQKVTRNTEQENHPVRAAKLMLYYTSFIHWSRIVWGRNDLLSLSVEQDSDSSLLLKLLLCLEMILFSGCSGLSIIDRSLLSTCRSATDVKLSISVPCDIWPGRSSWPIPLRCQVESSLQQGGAPKASRASWTLESLFTALLDTMGAAGDAAGRNDDYLPYTPEVRPSHMDKGNDVLPG